MTTVDLRTRLDGDVDLWDPTEFLEERIPSLLEARGQQAGVAASRLELVPLTLDVDGYQMTLAPKDGSLEARPGGDGALVVALDRQAFSELVQDASSTFGLQLTGRSGVRRGTVEAFIAGSHSCASCSTGVRSTSPASSTSATVGVRRSTWAGRSARRPAR